MYLVYSLITLPSLPINTNFVKIFSVFAAVRIFDIKTDNDVKVVVFCRFSYYFDKILFVNILYFVCFFGKSKDVNILADRFGKNFIETCDTIFVWECFRFNKISDICSGSIADFYTDAGLGLFCKLNGSRYYHRNNQR